MQPLQNIRVLAVTVFLAGPYTSMNLARFGAEVIKVEIPNRGDPVRGNGPFAGPEGIQAEQLSEEYISTRFLKRTQGVKSITLDLKTDKGKEMFIELAKQSDVLLENLAPGSLKNAPLDASHRDGILRWGTANASMSCLQMCRVPIIGQTLGHGGHGGTVKATMTQRMF